jgi:hypothetical protein
VIGRNEGQRLIECFQSLSGATNIVYVDSNSTDGSVEAARARNIEVVELDLVKPFTAARARNAGFRRLIEVSPNCRYVQFVDGDCQLAVGWPEKAIAFLERRTDFAAVCGRLTERYPDRSVYNWLCDKEWDRPTGEVSAFAGNVMMRIKAFSGVHGYREDLIAGEEAELCVRLRQANWRIWRLEDNMALHDAAMTHFRQWWRRSIRAGYAFAHGCYLHGALPERHFVRETRRIMVWGVVLPVSGAAVTIIFPHFGWLIWIIYPLQLMRLILRSPGSLSDRIHLGSFHLLARFPEAIGMARFWWGHMFNRQHRIIEHKEV